MVGGVVHLLCGPHHRYGSHEFYYARGELRLNVVVGFDEFRLTLGKVVYFGRCVPWIIIDAIPYFRRWKLQPVRCAPKFSLTCRTMVLLTIFEEQGPHEAGAMGMHKIGTDITFYD